MFHEFFKPTHTTTDVPVFKYDEHSDTDKQPTEIKEWSLDELENKLKELGDSSRPISPLIRVELFKMILSKNPKNPEKVPSILVRKMFDYDLNFAINCLNKWQDKKELGEKSLANIKSFFSKIKLPDEMSFFEHSYYCFCLSALMTGIEPENLNKEYNKPIKTMVPGVIHPIGKWSIKTELEHQDYSYFIAHVSKTGLLKIEDINDATCFRLDNNSPFSGIRLFAVACGTNTEFDGVKEMKVDGQLRDVRSLEVLIHDFIHAAFLRYHFEKSPKDFHQRFEVIGLVYEAIKNAPELKNDKELYKRVMLAWFFFMHEYTTSIFVNGIPTALPKRHVRVQGKYALEPQMYLDFAAKLNLLSGLFKNEVDVEADLFESLSIHIKDKDLSDPELVKKIMGELDIGYSYLNDKFSEFYDTESDCCGWLGSLLSREGKTALNYLMHALSKVSGNQLGTQVDSDETSPEFKL